MSNYYAEIDIVYLCEMSGRWGYIIMLRYFYDRWKYCPVAIQEHEVDSQAATHAWTSLFTFLIYFHWIDFHLFEVRMCGTNRNNLRICIVEEFMFFYEPFSYIGWVHYNQLLLGKLFVMKLYVVILTFWSTLQNAVWVFSTWNS